jgi:hypothetical protein
VRAGLHYIVVNLAASLLFLIGVSLIYGVSGTLNMADLAARIPNIAEEDRALLEAGAAILGVAFLLQAAPLMPRNPMREAEPLAVPDHLLTVKLSSVRPERLLKRTR